ncbi:MAG TPA: hypothetical protein VMT27_00380 [Actinomycetes bacterium]|nr:hypothetical protein [Actinomycetes bacterium]
MPSRVGSRGAFGMLSDDAAAAVGDLLPILDGGAGSGGVAGGSRIWRTQRRSRHRRLLAGSPNAKVEKAIGRDGALIAVAAVLNAIAFWKVR